MTHSIYPDLSQIKKILVIKIRNLGDVLLTSPIFPILKDRFPRAKIDLYINQEGVDLMESHPCIDEIIPYDRSCKKKFIFSRFFYEWKILQSIRKNKYDLILNLTEGDRGAICAKVSKAPITVGFDPGESRSKRKIYTHLVKVPGPPRHTVEIHLDALRRIGIFPRREEKKLSLFVKDKARKKVSELLTKKGVSSFIMIHPVARWTFKRWPEEKVQALLYKLLERGEKMVITAGNDPKEMASLNRITKDIHSDNLLVCNGTLSLAEFAAMIENSSLLISMDTLAAHIASSLQKKLVVLFGPTSEQKWGPWQNDNAIVLTKPFSCRPCFMDGCGGSKRSQCLEEIEVEEVLEAMEKLQETLFSHSSN